LHNLFPRVTCLRQAGFSVNSFCVLDVPKAQDMQGYIIGRAELKLGPTGDRPKKSRDGDDKASPSNSLSATPGVAW
jgi:hypothetical protein